MTPPAGPEILSGPAAADHPAGPDKLAPETGGHVAGPPLLWAIPSAVTLAVMLWGNQRPSYWRDEAATLAAARRPFGDLVAMLGHVDAVHGAYYMIIWVVARLGGTGEFATRLPSALAMAAAAAGAAAIGRRLVSPRAGLFAGLVLASLPEISWYGQDTRSYAMVAALATTASYLLVRLLQADGPRRGWLVSYGLAMTATGLVNIFGLTLAAAHGLTVAHALRRPAIRLGRRRLLAGWLAAVAIASAAACPLFALAWAQRSQQRWLKPPGLRTLLALHYLVGPPALVIVVLLVIGCGIAVSAAGGPVMLSARWPARLPALCLPWLLLPAAILLAGSLIQPVYTLRYVLFSLPALALLAGAGLAALGRAAGLIALAVMVLVSVPEQVSVRWHGAHGDNIRMADMIVARARQPGDAVIYATTDARHLAAAYPYGLAALRNIALDRTPGPSGTLGGTYRPAPAVRGLLSGIRRIWVVGIGGRRARPAILHGAGFQVVRRWRPSDIWLTLVRRRTGPYRRHRAPRAPRVPEPAAAQRPLP